MQPWTNFIVIKHNYDIYTGLEQSITSYSSSSDITERYQSRTASSASPETTHEGMSFTDGGNMSTMNESIANTIPPNNGTVHAGEQPHGGNRAQESPRNTSASATSPKNGLFKMSSNHKLQVLLNRIASRDTSYDGMENMTPCSSTPADLSSEKVPRSFSTHTESPSTKPPLLHHGM